jgi:acetolactate synthase-1/3 small subunit
MKRSKVMRHTLSVLVENEPGVLSRVAGLFSGRGFNIESLNVAPTLEQGISLMTIVTDGEEQIIEQIIKQLRKIISVVKVVDMNEIKCVDREMVLLKVNAMDQYRAEVLRIVDIFRCKVVDVSPAELTLEATGDRGKISALIQLLTRFGIKEIARTGSVTMRRSMQTD